MTFLGFCQLNSLRGNKDQNKWTAEEDKILEKGRDDGKTWKEISVLLPHRTMDACSNRSGRLLAAAGKTAAGKTSTRLWREKGKDCGGGGHDCGGKGKDCGGKGKAVEEGTTVEEGGMAVAGKGKTVEKGTASGTGAVLEALNAAAVATNAAAASMASMKVAAVSIIAATASMDTAAASMVAAAAMFKVAIAAEVEGRVQHRVGSEEYPIVQLTASVNKPGV